jgi:GT2 family glycosyltransferase
LKPHLLTVAKMRRVVIVKARLRSPLDARLLHEFPTVTITTRPPLTTIFMCGCDLSIWVLQFNQPRMTSINAAALRAPLAHVDAVLGYEGPIVSFVIPVRNDARRLERCLKSIAANRFPQSAIEIVVVDNGSDDGSDECARQLGATVMSVPRGTVAQLRNRGAAASRGSIVAFVDADHELDRDWIAAAVEMLASGGGTAAAGAPYSSAPQPTWVQRQCDAMRVRSSEAREVNWLGSGNLAVTRNAFDRVGGFDERLTACEDVDFCNRLRLQGQRLIADPRLRSVHFGDPATLRSLFLGELWRGRDNVRVTFRGPWTIRDLRSAIAPIVTLLALALAVAGLLTGRLLWCVALLLAALVPSAINTVRMCRRQGRFAPQDVAQAFAFAAVFDLARALALVIPGSHRARQSK